MIVNGGMGLRVFWYIYIYYNFGDFSGERGSGWDGGYIFRFRFYFYFRKIIWGIFIFIFRFKIIDS